MTVAIEEAVSIKAELDPDFDEPTLTANDMCDACGVAIAFVRIAWTGEDPRELDFCGHHFAENEASIKEAGWVVTIDRRYEIDKRQQHIDVWTMKRDRDRRR